MQNFDFRKIWREVCAEKTSQKTATWWTVSGLTGNGVELLVSHLFEIVPEGPQLFPEDVLTDYPRKLAIADVVREKYFQWLRDELPRNGLPT